MKRILSILTAVLLVPFLAAVSCTPESLEEAAEGLSVKAFMPTAVMAGGEMVIMGNNLDQVVSIVFPDDISVTDFKVVTANQIKVRIPSGIAREGGKLILKSADRQVESAVSMRLARPVVKSLDPGDEIKPGRTLTIKGEDMDFIARIQFPAMEEGETVDMEAMDFQRKSPDNIKVTVPEGIISGMGAMTLVALDGSTLKTPEINFVSGPSADDDYIVATIMNVAAERYLTRSGYTSPVIADRTGGKNQEFTFIPVEGEYGSYYMRNNDTEEYLSIGEEYEWRMVWYADPSEASKPENAKFQVFPIEGTDYYRIHALGSVDFGIDSTGDGSEVYSNKSGKTNPYYQWIINRISGPEFSDPNATPPAKDVVIWEGSAEPDPNDSGWVSLYLEPELFGELAVGRSIRMYFTPTEGEWLSLDFRDKNDGAFPGYEWAGMSDFPTYAEGYIDMDVNEDVYDRVRAGGISLRGFWFTITKVAIVGEPDSSQGGTPADGRVIWEGSWDCGGWSGNQDLAWGGFDWSTVAAGTVMVMYFTEDDTQGWWQIALRHGDGWEDIPESNFFELSAGQTSLEVTLTQVILDDLLAHNGLILTGCNYVLNKIVLIEP